MASSSTNAPQEEQGRTWLGLFWYVAIHPVSGAAIALTALGLAVAHHIADRGLSLGPPPCISSETRGGSQ